jgi:hypothetical protein
MRKLYLISILILAGCGGAGIMPGPVGPQGPKGDPGTSCTVSTVLIGELTPTGGALITCDDGTNAFIANGANGSNGSNGTNGTVVTPIQFCPGTSSYPSTFIEVGFCINDSIWAVYSANGGFLTEILPGKWSSNAIGSRCDFTVLPHCRIK